MNTKRSLAALLLAFSFGLIYSNKVVNSQSKSIQKSDQLIIKFKPGAPERLMLRSIGLSTKKSNKKLGFQVAKVQKGKNPKEVIALLKKRYKGAIEYAEVDKIIPLNYVPNDPYFGYQWHHETLQSTEAWERDGTTSIVVAVADTGIDTDHPDLAAITVGGVNVVSSNTNIEDSNGHGTMVAGVIAAIHDNETLIAGIAPNARIMPIKVSESEDGSAHLSDLINAITYAAQQNVKIINVSYGPLCGSQAMEDATAFMRSKGGFVIIAAGNDGQEYTCSDDPAAIYVSATGKDDLKTSWSTYGNFVDVSAPGESIATTLNTGNAGYANGTSFSAPLVAGIIAQIWGTHPDLSLTEVENILYKALEDKGTLGADNLYGKGRVNLLKALEETRRLMTDSETTPDDVFYSSPKPTPDPEPTPDPDTKSPTLSILSPTEGTSVSTKGILKIRVQASDESSIKEIQILFDSQIIGICGNVSVCEDSIQAKIMSTGQHIVSAKATDSFGNTSTKSITITSQAKKNGRGRK